MPLLPVVSSGTCPRCDDARLESDPEGNTRCPRCHGRWFPRGTLGALLGLAEDHPFLVEHRRGATLTARRCPDCRASMLCRMRLGRDFSLMIDHCPICLGQWLDEGLLPRVSAAASALPRPAGAGKGALPAPDRLDPEGLFSDRFAYDVPWVNGLALPAALGLALLLDATWLRHLVSNFFVNMWLHELGHAAVAWMSGYYALLLPFVTFTYNEEKSLLTSLIVALFLGAALLSGLSGKHRYLVFLGGGGLLLQFVLTVIVPRRLTFEWLTFGGCAGEIVWSTLLLVSFYHRLPDRIRWDFWRYLALLIGAFGLVHAMAMWMGVSHDLSTMPMGTALGGQSDGDGDMNRLLGVYRWTPRGVVNAYLRLGYACLAVVAGHYAFFLWRAVKKEE